MTAPTNMIDESPPHTDSDVQATAPDRASRPPISSLARVNGILGRWYRLQHSVDAYDVLHDAELARLKKRRAEAVGPTERRIDRLRAAVEDFAVSMFLGFNDTGHRVPNGDITSRPVAYSIDKTDDLVVPWLDLVEGMDDAIEMRPWVDMKKLRKWLDAQVKAGNLQRMVSRPAEVDEDVEFWLVDEKDGWTVELEPGDIGVWFWTSDASAHAEGEVLAGVTWVPNGTQGSGRNFAVKL